MFNERITEDIINQKFQPYHEQGFIIEKQESANPRINKLLQYASKSGKGKGYPDFIVQSETDTDFLMVVECKASVKKHKSLTLDHFADYAVDGALLYSSYLAKEFDVIALGVSGQKIDSLLADSFLQLKTYQKPIPFINKLLELPDYQKKYIYKEETRNQRFEILLDYNKELNQTLHIHKIREADRSLLLSGILIALEHEAFKNSYMLYNTAEQLAEALLNAVINELQNTNIPSVKIETLKHSYSFIKTNATLSNDKALFIRLIKEIDEKVNSFAKTYKFFDIFGEFYIEFLRYANNDKGLGIVLTPKHITELFCELANLTKDSVIFDNCCGTGSFLVSAMRDMIKKANHNNEKEIEIKEKQIIGIEYQDSIFPLACSNMIIHGDGKTNIINDNCFNERYGEIKNASGKITKKGVKLIEYINKKLQPTVGMLNPPFKTDKNDTEELNFVLNNLEGLEQNGLCLAILPMQCALSNKGERLALKIKLLENHTLKAVVSFPDDLFYNSNVSVVTCAMVIKAHNPHPKDYKTYFGYWKTDKFVKRKTKGRVDFFGEWNNIKEKWIISYKNKDSLPGISIMAPISAQDEWCAEKYMETNYKLLNKNNFIRTLLNYTSFLFSNRLISKALDKCVYEKFIELNINEWAEFHLNDKALFDIKGTKTTSILELEEHGEGKHPYVTTQATNNGIDNFYNHYTENGGVITFDSAVIGYCAYQQLPFSASDHVEKLIPKFKMNKYIALFLVTILNQEQYRFNYGRKCSQTRMREIKIRLPSKNNSPDWQFMEDYIKSLPYSSSI